MSVMVKVADIASPSGYRLTTRAKALQAGNHPKQLAKADRRARDQARVAAKRERQERAKRVKAATALLRQQESTRQSMEAVMQQKPRYR